MEPMSHRDSSASDSDPPLALGLAHPSVKTGHEFLPFEWEFWKAQSSSMKAHHLSSMEKSSGVPVVGRKVTPLGEYVSPN